MEALHETIFQSAADLSCLDSESIDLVVTSPPYPMIEMWDGILGEQDRRIVDAIQDGDGFSAFELMHRILDKIWSECYRVLKAGAFACINIGDATRKIGQGFRLYTNHSRITSFCETIGFQSLPAILRSAFFWEERNVWFSDIWDFKGVRQSLGEKESRQRKLGYLNKPHGFPVMTRQEINLSIPIVTRIHKTETAQFRVHHEQQNGSSVLPVETKGFAHQPQSASQLNLALGS